MNRRALLRFTAEGLVVVTALGVVPLRAAAQQSGQDRAPSRKPAKVATIVLDPGHGGHDPGAIGAKGTYEKDVTLDIGKEVARQLGRLRGVKAILTRENDGFIGLADRVRLAREAEADLFISIHADSAPNPKARGFSAYTLTEEASDAFAAAIAAQENLSERFEVKGGKLPAAATPFLVDLAADHTKRASLVAKQTLVRGVGKQVRLLENPMRSANFAVLKAPDIPSVLIETGFLSNAEDEKLLRDPARRRQMAGLLARELAAVVAAAPFV